MFTGEFVNGKQEGAGKWAQKNRSVWRKTGVFEDFQEVYFQDHANPNNNLKRYGMLKGDMFFGKFDTGDTNEISFGIV